MFDIKGFTKACVIISRSEAAIRDAANEWAPAVIAQVREGGNIAHVNQFINAFSGVRRERVLSTIKRFVPHDFDKDSDSFVGKLKNKKLAATREETFDAFLESGKTFWELIEERKAADKKPVNHLQRFTKAAETALAEGFSLDELLAVLQAAAVAAEAAEKAA